MISSIFISTSSISFLSGLYFYKKYHDQTQIFDQIGNSFEYDLDKITDITQLPLNKFIILNARTEFNQEIIYKSKYNPNKEIIFSILKPKMKKNYILQTDSDSILRFNLKNALSQIIHINHIGKDIQLFNLPQLKNNEKSLKNSNLKEYVIYPEEQYQFIGFLYKINNQIIMKPKYILGDNIVFLSQFMNKQILDLRKKSIQSFSLCFMIYGLHFILTRYAYYQKNQQRQK